MVELGKSKIPLQEDIIKLEPPKEFFREIIEKGERKIRIASTTGAGGSSKRVYIVPAGKIFFLNSAYLDFLNNAAGDNQSSLFINSLAEVLLDMTMKTKTSDRVTISFPIPILLKEGEQIFVFDLIALGFSKGIITGYELSKRIPGVF